MIRALHEWCSDNGFTPYLAVSVDATVRVPSEYVRNDEIVLNVGFDATSGLTLGNEWIEFKARFGGVARDILVPVDRVLAIYARENGQGMAFPVPPPRPTVAEPRSASPLKPVDERSARPAPPEVPSPAPVLRLAPAVTSAAASASAEPSKPAAAKARSSRRKAAPAAAGDAAAQAPAAAAPEQRTGKPAVRTDQDGKAAKAAKAGQAVDNDRLPTDTGPSTSPPSPPPGVEPRTRPALKRVK